MLLSVIQNYEGVFTLTGDGISDKWNCFSKSTSNNDIKKLCKAGYINVTYVTGDDYMRIRTITINNL